ncbi:exoribonuclease II [Candidatus Erwinia haradaeae]|uniref:Exoribonuclease 2 n=1 Tax=Candidatus Erwinia haradaeae TaxID=1922217 RepID=A0A803FUU0_9GAMM|nr:exoribonuclease II [Candidatus Erwinia haradaeae]VFP88489.1 Exoribonuclease 2 [Candidatus Erwinia haradaeae]
MLQDNPLLVQLKKQLNSKLTRVEGVVKGSEKGFGFLEISAQKSYFIPRSFMKKVMNGDRISAVIQTHKDREIACPEKLIEPCLQRFVGRIQKKNNRLFIIPDHPWLKNAIPCNPRYDLNHCFQDGDWTVAKIQSHPLNGDEVFYAELTEFITTTEDHLAPWWVTLARYDLEREAPDVPIPTKMINEKIKRKDLTEIPFITIDNAHTEDMDDALYIEDIGQGRLKLFIAISDPTSYIETGSKLDQIASTRSFTNYLPGFNISMLPRKLSEDICSLRPRKNRPALVCCVTIDEDGTPSKSIEFFTAWIKSRARLVYNSVSDWLETNRTSSWQPENKEIANQIDLLHRCYLARSRWRKTYALLFKEQPDFRFVINKKGEILDIITEHRRIAHRIIEESMILANICAAQELSNKFGFGIYNVHYGFDKINADQVSEILSHHGIIEDPLTIVSLDGFRNLKRKLDSQPNTFLANRIRRFQSFAEIRTTPGPHCGLGLEAYATWTSPIRKYGDMVNHRLIKSIITGETGSHPKEELATNISDRRRKNRMAGRDISEWLYSLFLKREIGSNRLFTAEILDVSRSGMRIRLQENGAIAFIPSVLIYAVREDLICKHDSGSILVKGEVLYRVTDLLNVVITEVRMDTRTIIARPAFLSNKSTFR